MAETDPSLWCISYDQLLGVRDLALQHFGKDDYKKVTMRDICHRIILPRCLETGKSYALSLNPAGLPIDSFVTHSWDGQFYSFVESIQSVFQHKIQANFWICAFAINQAEVVLDDPFESPFVQALRKASTFCVVRNSMTDLYSRIWCVCELMYATNSDLYPNHTYVTGPNVFSGLQTSCLDAKASRKEDRVKVLRLLLEDYDVSEIDRIVQIFRRHGAPKQYGYGDLADNQQKEDKNLQEILSPLFTLDESMIAEHMSRLQPGSRTWAVEGFDKWLNCPHHIQPKHRVFVLNALAGLGKTALCCKIIHERKQHILAFHFCRHDDSRRSDPKVMLLSLAYQISCQVSEYKIALKEIIKRKNFTRDVLLKDLSVLGIFEELISIPLKQVPTPDQTFRHYVVVIDALDECAEDLGKNEILLCIQRHFLKLPPWIKFFITARPEVAIVEKLKKFSPVTIAPDEVHNRNDLMAFFRNLLLEFGSDLLKPGGKGHEVALATLTNKAEGLFIFASYLYDMSRQGMKKIESLLELEQFPTGLDEFYEMQLERMLTHASGIEWQIIEFITAAREPLHVEAIQQLLRCSRSERVAALRLLSSFFPIDHSRKVRVAHKSFKDWLVDRKREDEEFYVDMLEVEKSLGIRCLDILKSTGIAITQPYQTVAGAELHAEAIRYALRHCVFHLCAGGMHGYSQPILLNISYLMAKAEAGASADLVAEFQMAKKDDKVLHLVGRAIQLSLHALRRSTRQLPGQLIGRLLSSSAESRISNFLFDIKNFDFGFDFFCPIQPTWDQAAQPCVCILDGHRTEVLSLAASRDGSYIASGSEDGTARIWSSETGECQVVLVGHEKQINAVVWNNSHQIITGSDDRSIRLWDALTGECEIQVNEIGAVVCLEVSFDEKVIAASGAFIREWDLKTRYVTRTVGQHQHKVTSISLFNGGPMLASSSDDGEILIWNLANGSCRRIWNNRGSRVSTVKWSPDGRLASCRMDGSIQIWEKGAENPVTEQLHDVPLGALAWSPDGGKIVIGGASKGGMRGEIFVWDVSTNKKSDRLTLHQGSEISLDWTATTNRIISATKSFTQSKDLSLRVWDPAIVNSVYESRRSFDVAACSAWSPDGSLVAFGSHEGVIRLCESATGACSRVLDDHKAMISSLSFSIDGVLASSSWDFSIKIWTIGADECHCTLKGHTSMVQFVKWSPSGKLLASSSYDMTIRIWSAETWDTLQVIHSKSESLTTVLSWGGSTHIVTGNETGTIGVWTVGDDEGREIKGLHDRVQCLACSHDGLKVVSAHGNVCVWLLATGEILFKLRPHDLRYHEVMWSKDDIKLLLPRRLTEGTVQVDSLTVLDARSGAFLESIAKDQLIPEDFDTWEAAAIVRPRSFRRDPLDIAATSVSVFGDTACAMLESREIKFFTLISSKN